MQIEAYKRLAAAGVKQEVIIEILKDKSNAWAIASADGTVDIKNKFGDLLKRLKSILILLSSLQNKQKPLNKPHKRQLMQMFLLLIYKPEHYRINLI